MYVPINLLFPSTNQPPALPTNHQQCPLNVTLPLLSLPLPLKPISVVNTTTPSPKLLFVTIVTAGCTLVTPMEPPLIPSLKTCSTVRTQLSTRTTTSTTLVLATSFSLRGGLRFIVWVAIVGGPTWLRGVTWVVVY